MIKITNAQEVKNVTSIAIELCDKINACESVKEFDAFLNSECNDWERNAVNNLSAGYVLVNTYFYYKGYKCSFSTGCGGVSVQSEGFARELLIAGAESLRSDLIANYKSYPTRTITRAC